MQPHEDLIPNSPKAIPLGDGSKPSNVRTYLDAHVTDLVEQLMEWIRLPSVAGSPERAPNIVRSANWLASALREAGFPSVRIVPTGDTHAVLADWSVDPELPTVLIYSHHDVRAAKEELWDQTHPFEPMLREGKVYGRGSSDAKGQVLEHIWGIRAHLACGRIAPAVNLKLLVEGEEEVGSPHLQELLDAENDALTCDLVLFSDTMMWRADHPAICTSMRGTLNAHLEVLGPLRDVHSGAVSGPAPNPVLEVCKLLGGLHDSNGRIAIPGFYDGVDEPSPQRRAELAALPYSDDDWLRRSETRSITGEVGYTVLERLWTRPAIEVTTMVAGDPVGPSRSAIPSMVSCDLSIRTVAGQTMEAVTEQIRSWVADNLPGTVDYRLSVSTDTGQIAYETPDHPAVAALERAMKLGYRTASIGRMGNAGGGPADLLSSSLGVPVVFFGTGLVENHWHDSDEYLLISTMLDGAASLGFFWSEVGSAFGASPNESS
jgi:acetylornithine deacetylase/succinyl-diaminopimelate desuccinylase-like protein